MKQAKEPDVNPDRAENMVTITPFSVSEFEARLSRAQKAMAAINLDAILISSLAAFRYFTGYNPIISESPARPWFSIVPAKGDLVAIIPEMGAGDMPNASWVKNIEHWPSPRPSDEGVSLLAARLNALPIHSGRLGAELGPETRLGMPQSDFARLASACSSEFVDASFLLQQVRAIKSPAELERIRHAGSYAGHAFDTVPSWLQEGLSEHQVHRRFQAELLNAGVDYVRYLAIGSGENGYDSMCRGPLPRHLKSGDVLALDTGATVDGYFCDFDRNFALGNPAIEVHRAYSTLHAAIDAGLAAVKPQMTCSELWKIMMQVLSDAGAQGGKIGRMGHGLGLALTEQPSLHPDDHTIIEEGMVLTLEPALVYVVNDNSHLMVHEENIVVQKDGADLLSPRAAPEIVVIG